MALDDLLAYISKQIALDGEFGSSLERIWEFAHEFHTTTTPQSPTLSDSTPTDTSNGSQPKSLDPAYKALVWRWLCRLPGYNFLLIPAHGLSFKIEKTTSMDTPAKPKRGSKRKAVDDTAAKDLPPLPNQSVNASLSRRLGLALTLSDTPHAEDIRVVYSTDPHMQQQIGQEAGQVMTDFPDFPPDQLEDVIYERHHTRLVTNPVSDQPTDHQDEPSFVLVIQASRDKIFSHLLLGQRDVTLVNQSAGYVVLQAIARYRHAGITGVELNEILHVDPRSMFHYLRVLHEHQLITKQSVIKERSQSALCHHVAFTASSVSHEMTSTAVQRPLGTPAKSKYNADNSPLTFDQPRLFITRCLEQATNRTLLYSDLRDRCGEGRAGEYYRKAFTRMIIWMCERGYTEKINVPTTHISLPETTPATEDDVGTQQDSDAMDTDGVDGSSDEEPSPTKKILQSKRKVLCVRLLRPYTAASESTDITTKKYIHPHPIPYHPVPPTVAPLSEPAEPSGATRKGKARSGSSSLMAVRPSLLRTKQAALYYPGQESPLNISSIAKRPPLILGHKSDDEDGLLPQGPKVFLPQEIQLYQLLAQTGDTGTTIEDLMAQLPMANARGVGRDLEQLMAKSSAKQAYTPSTVSVKVQLQDDGTCQPLSDPYALQELIPKHRLTGVLENVGRLRRRRIMMSNPDDPLIALWARSYFAIPACTKSLPWNSKAKEENPPIQASETVSHSMASPVHTGGPLPPAINGRQVGNGQSDLSHSDFEQCAIVENHCQHCRKKKTHLHLIKCGSCQRNFHLSCVSATSSVDPVLSSWCCSEACKRQATQPGVLDKAPHITESLASKYKRTPHNSPSTPRQRKGVTNEQRQEVLLEMLRDSNGILMINEDFTVEFTKKFNEKYETLPHRVDKRTLLRLSKNLATRGEVHVQQVSFPLLTGRLMHTTLLQKPGLDAAAVKSYLSRVADKHALHKQTLTPVKTEKVHVEGNPIIIRSKPTPVSKRGPQDSVEDRANSPTDGSPGSFNYDAWIRSYDLGYIHSKFRRAKLLHLWLLSFLNTVGNVDHEYVFPHHCFRAITLYRSLPLSLYLQLVSLRRVLSGGRGAPTSLPLPSEMLDTANGSIELDDQGTTSIDPVNDLFEYLYEHRNADIPVSDIPSRFHRSLFQSYFYFRSYIDNVLAVLCALHILHPVQRDVEDVTEDVTFEKLVNDVERSVSTNGTDTEWTLQSRERRTDLVYQLATTAPVKIVSSEPRCSGIYRILPTCTEEDVNKYWEELEYVCNTVREQELDTTKTKDSQPLRKELARSTLGHAQILPQIVLPPKVAEALVYTNARGHDPLRYMTYPPSWTTFVLLTAEQRKQLDGFINTVTGETPLMDYPQCNSIASAMGLPLAQVFAHYRRSEFTRQKRLLKMANTSQPKGNKRTQLRQFLSATFDATASRDNKEAEPSKSTVVGIAKRIPRFEKRIRKAQALNLLAPHRPDSKRLRGYQQDDTVILEQADELMAQVKPRWLSNMNVRSERIRQQWDPSMDEHLCQFYVVMHHSIQDSLQRFLWVPALLCFPDSGTLMAYQYCASHPVVPLKALELLFWVDQHRTTLPADQFQKEYSARVEDLLPTLLVAYKVRNRLSNRLRHRFNRLRSRRDYPDRIRHLHQHWNHYYHYGVREGHIPSYTAQAQERKQFIEGQQDEVVRHWLAYWRQQLLNNANTTVQAFREQYMDSTTVRDLARIADYDDYDFNLIYTWMMHELRLTRNVINPSVQAFDNTWYLDGSVYIRYWDRFINGDLKDISLSEVQRLNRLALGANPLPTEIKPKHAGPNATSAQTRSKKKLMSADERYRLSTTTVKVLGYRLPEAGTPVKSIFSVEPVESGKEYWYKLDESCGTQSENTPYHSGALLIPCPLHWEFLLHQCCTTAKQQEVLQQATFSTRLNPNTWQFNPQGNSNGSVQEPSSSGKLAGESEQRAMTLVQSLIKMILLTPAKTYDPIQAISILNNCERLTPHSVDQAIDRMKAQGAITRMRTKARNIPGRGYNVSETFLSALVTHYPQAFFRQSQTLLTRFEATLPGAPLDQRLELGQLISSGAIATALEIVANGRGAVGSVHFKDLPDINYDFLRQEYQHPRTRTLAFLYYNYYLDPCDSLPRGMPLQVDRSMKDDIATNEDLDNAVVALVEESGESGRTAGELVKLLRATPEFQPIADRAVVNSLGRLCEPFATTDSKRDCPRRLVAVGFYHIRYVVPEFISPWSVALSRFETTEQDNSGSHANYSDLTVLNPKDTSDRMVPRVWRDIQGRTVPYILYNCLRAVLHTVARSPGITRDNIGRSLRIALCPAEVDELLERLVQQNLVEVAFISQPAKPSLFSPLRSFELTNELRVTDSYVACYTARSTYVCDYPEGWA
ncbi:hypothetical protein IWQ62_002034 [Dispira parvispora]|uniref:Uncharacterized protein n=1 Tax=Dispira parvispora TaxID=1520584 RepID=A0A9W8E8E8_9FUNG|nr:hypothetical protein IWQ62_002034 [Dispira parvispora]